MKIKPQTCLAVAMLVLAGSSRPVAAAYPASLPQFKSKDELQKEIQSRRAASKGLTVEIFYTGKPYESSEGYLYKYRTYDSVSNRWTSNDPSGFPDGPNNTIYAPCPVSQLDPTGLDTVNVTWTPHTGPSGGIFSFTVSPPDANPLVPYASMILSLHVNSSYSGWIVQHITMDFTHIYNDSDGSQFTTPDWNTSYDYWEAWKVTDGSIDPSTLDNYKLDYPTSTHGTASITGQIDFFQSSVFTSLTGNNNPINWSLGKNITGAKPAGDLKATTTEPSFWSDSGYNHNMTMTWE